jgi:hypothetical protein
MLKRSAANAKAEASERKKEETNASLKKLEPKTDLSPKKAADTPNHGEHQLHRSSIHIVQSKGREAKHKTKKQKKHFLLRAASVVRTGGLQMPGLS